MLKNVDRPFWLSKIQDSVKSTSKFTKNQAIGPFVNQDRKLASKKAT